MYINTVKEDPPKSTKLIHFGVFFCGFATKPSAAVRFFWSHVASSFRLPRLSLVSSQRPPPHSLNWTSWYWNRKMGVNPMFLGTATTMLWYWVCALPSPGCCGAPDWSGSCPAVYRFGTAVPRPPPSERWWPHPRLWRKLKSEKNGGLGKVWSGSPLEMKPCKYFQSRAVGVVVMHSWMLEIRAHTCIFGLQVEETSEAESLHFPRRQNIIPVEKNLLRVGFTYGNIWANLTISSW